MSVRQLCVWLRGLFVWFCAPGAFLVVLLVLLLVFAWLCWGGAAPAIIPVGLCLDIAMGQTLWFVRSVCICISGVWLDLGLSDSTGRVEYLLLVLCVLS